MIRAPKPRHLTGTAPTSSRRQTTHQDLYQLHKSVPEVERSLLSNAYSQICFRVGEEDARGLAKGL